MAMSDTPTIPTSTHEMAPQAWTDNGTGSGNTWPSWHHWGDTPHAGASTRRKQLHNWMPMRLPADADLIPDLPALVARARDLSRNNGVAAAGLQTLQDNVAGTGLRLAAMPDYRALGKTAQWAEDWSRTVESLWKAWAESTAPDAARELNFASITQLVLRSGVENGEALVLPLWVPRMDTPFRTCLQLVESDRLSTPFNKAGLYSNVIGGIEKDPMGQPVAYYIRNAPSWNETLWALNFMYDWNWERVPAQTPFGRKRVLHVHQKERIGQSRGRPILAPIIEQFRMLDSYQRTELQSAIVNALVAGVIETPVDASTLLESVGGNPAGYLAMKNEYRVELEGGTVMPLFPGDKFTSFAPSRPSGQFPAFVESISRQIGTAMGLPYELALKDFSKTNYSSARAALLEAWRFFTVRRQWLATYFAAPVYELWLEEAVDLGLVEAPDFYENRRFYSRSKWIGMGRGYIDPTKEAEAAQLRMEISVSTLEQECAEQGLDWNEVLEQRRQELDRMTELGLPLPPMYQKSPPRGEQPESNAPAQPAPPVGAAA
jgi:lambda family phage portal protein